MVAASRGRTSVSDPKIVRMVRRAREIPRGLTAAHSVHAGSVNVTLACPKLAAELQCPSSRVVAFSLSHIACTGSVQNWAFTSGHGSYADTSVDAQVGEWLVRL